MQYLRTFFMLCFIFVQNFGAFSPAWAIMQVRIKDIVSVEGVRYNQLVGYGLVVGLSGTGDNVGSIPFTKESLAGMLERLGVNVRDQQGNINLSGKNVAAVMVTGNLPAFSRQGSRIDVTVSALGDAKDLRGGTLLVTPLLAADGQVYAVAQGPVAVAGFTAQGATGSSLSKGVPTAGRIASGATVEKEVDFELNRLTSIKLNLNNPDFTTAKRLADRINQKMGGHLAHANDPSTVTLNVPGAYKGRTVEFMTAIEHLQIEPDQVAKIVINDSDGILVMGGNVRISTVAISHGSITIKITETPEVSQPNPFINANSYSLFASQGQQSPMTVNPLATASTNPALTIGAGATTTNTTTNTTNTAATGTGATATNATANTQNNTTAAVQSPQLNIPTPQATTFGQAGIIAPGPGTAIVNRSDVKVTEKKGKMAVLESGATLQELVDGLNALGATPRETIAILQAIKAAGALQAEIEVI